MRFSYSPVCATHAKCVGTAMLGEEYNCDTLYLSFLCSFYLLVHMSKFLLIS
jgi:hypothetical protein